MAEVIVSSIGAGVRAGIWGSLVAVARGVAFVWFASPTLIT